MLAKTIAILGAVAVLPVFMPRSSAPVPRYAKARPVQRRRLPMQNRSDHEDGTVSSTNWSGYAVIGNSFVSAEGSWIVPPATCPSGYQYAAFWVGLDGYFSDTVEQTGTDSDCDGGTPSYYAWFEFYPRPSFNINTLSIAPGDRMWAKVVYGGNSEFSITITDVTTGQSYIKSATVPNAKRTSAEWIAEAPCCTAHGAILPLADFGTVLFGEDSTGISGTNRARNPGNSGPIGSFSDVKAITMETNHGIDKAIPSGLSGDGTSFSLVWTGPTGVQDVVSPGRGTY